MEVKEQFGETDEERRFLIELEFIQALSNPQYLHFLAGQRYFSNPAFINYLKYLLYWKKPEYSKYILYPQSLHFIELLQHEKFRDNLANIRFIHQLSVQQNLHWQLHRNTNLKLGIFDEDFNFVEQNSLKHRSYLD